MNIAPIRSSSYRPTSLCRFNEGVGSGLERTFQSLSTFNSWSTPGLVSGHNDNMK